MSRGSGTDSPTRKLEIRGAAVALLVGREELNLDYCMLLSVVTRVDYDHEQSFDIMNFFNSCFKSFHMFIFNTLKYFEEREREKQPNTVKTWGEIKCKKESEQ